MASSILNGCCEKDISWNRWRRSHTCLEVHQNDRGDQGHTENFGDGYSSWKCGDPQMALQVCEQERTVDFIGLGETGKRAPYATI